MQLANYFLIFRSVFKSNETQIEGKDFIFPLEVRVVGSNLTGCTMDDSSQMPAELNVSLSTQQIYIIQPSLSDTDDGFLGRTATRV